MSSELLTVKNLSISFPARDPSKKIKVVDSISFSLEKSKILGIVGESGSGKTQTALSLMRLSPNNATLTSNEILLGDLNLKDLSEKSMCEVRGRKVSMIFQEPMTSLNPVFSIGKQIKEGLFRHLQLSDKEATKRALELLDQVGLNDPERRLKEYPHQISGGMRQRVMIAMALACDPDLLIADEPTTALDVTTQAQILHLLKHLQKTMGLSILLITHDLGVVAEVCDEVLVMYAGKVVEKGSLKDIFTRPSHPYTKALLEAIPRLGSTQKLKPIPGMIPAPGQLPGGCSFNPRCSLVQEKCLNQKPSLEPTKARGQLSACFFRDQMTEAKSL